MKYILLTAVLLFCHYLADYTHLSRPYMLAAKRFGKPLWPIFIHACTHGTLMGCALLLFNVKTETTLWLVCMQVLSHFIIDVLKGRINIWIPMVQQPAKVWHWVVFGADQYFHQVIILWMVLIALN